MINFITAYTREENLLIIYSSISNQTEDFNWYIIEGSNTNLGEPKNEILKNDDRVKYYKINTNFFWGYEQRNYFIKEIGCDEDDWCYFLDDDNVVTWDLIDTLENEDSSTDLVLFSQKAGLTEKIRLYGTEDRLSLGNCDTGSFAARYRLIKDSEIIAHLRNGDGHYCNFLRSLKEKNTFKYYENKYVRYNALSINIF